MRKGVGGGLAEREEGWSLGGRGRRVVGGAALLHLARAPLFHPPSMLKVVTLLRLTCFPHPPPLRVVMEHVVGCRPRSLMLAAGWSLGANILLRYLGEQVWNGGRGVGV